MDALQIKVFIDAMAASGLAEMQASKDGWSLRLVRDSVRDPVRDPMHGNAAAPSPAVAAAGGPGEQCSSLCGVVFLRSSPGALPFVQVGQAVTTGQTLCVIEAMKIFNEVGAQCDGIVEAVLVESGQEVEVGQPLVRLR